MKHNYLIKKNKYIGSLYTFFLFNIYKNIYLYKTDIVISNQ